MTFVVTKLLGGGTLVEGADITGREGRTILVSDRWDAYQSIKAHKQAAELFDAQVEEFFKPITEAAEAAMAVAHPEAEDWRRIVISDGVDGTEPEVISLDMDGVLLRLLDEDRTDLLRWVGEDTLVAIQA